MGSHGTYGGLQKLGFAELEEFQGCGWTWVGWEWGGADSATVLCYLINVQCFILETKFVSYTECVKPIYLAWLLAATGTLPMPPNTLPKDEVRQ